MPSVSSMPSMPSLPSMPQMVATPASADSSIPSISSDGAMAAGLPPRRSRLSIPPFRKNRLPFIIVGLMVASVGLLLIVGVVSSSSWFDADPPVPGTAVTATAAPIPTPTATETTAPRASDALNAAPAEPEGSSSVADVETPPSENDTKGGSSGTSTARPVYTAPPKATPKGTRPYLPDLP